VVPLTEADLPLFRDHRRPLPERVDDLVGRLTVEEKIALLHQYQPPIARLGVGRFITGTEAVHGVARGGPATVFPQAVGLASTWNPRLVEAVGSAAGTEVRALWRTETPHIGLNVWAPVVNLLRDPRWGRNEEGYAEDPLLTAVLATAFSRGLRGDHPQYLRTAPTLKHFLAYNNETRRCETSSNLPPRVLHEYELPAFRAPIERDAAVAVMASYNLVNGRPAHLSPLIGDKLRRWADGETLVVSDAWAPNNVATLQGYYPDHVTSHAAMLRAGIDSFTDQDADPGATIERITAALRRGLIGEPDLDTALWRVFTIRFRLGEFDPPELNPYASVPATAVDCPEHRALAREAARQSIVLLKNDGGALPLAPAEIRRVAVVGPLADTLYEDWYAGTLPYAVTAFQGIAERLGPGAEVTFAEGVDRIVLGSDPGTEFDLFDWGEGVCALRAVDSGLFLTVDDDGVVTDSAQQPQGWFVRETFALEPSGDAVAIRHLVTGRYLATDSGGRYATATARTDFLLERRIDGAGQAAAAARAADVAVVVLGNHPLINGRETEDRAGLALPPAQARLLRAVHAANPRTVAVLSSSYPYAIGWAQAQVPAVLWSAHGGQEYGNALAEVLFGDVSPAGRLTQTWYRSDRDLPDLFDYDIIANDATYLYFAGEPLYPFGHGLTYPEFEYGDLRLSAGRMSAGGSVTVTVEVRNRGDRDSDEVVQLYTRQRRSRVKQPLRRLGGFRRVSVPAGQTRTVTFTLRAADLAYWDVVGERYVVETARHDVLVGRSSADIRLTGGVQVDGDQVASWHTGRPLPAAGADAYARVEFVDATKVSGDAVLAAADGAWVRFDRVSFGPGVTGCTARMSGTSAGKATVVLRAGDPHDGPVIAELVADVAADRYAWSTASGTVAAINGPVDVFAVLGSAGVCLRDLSFTAS
jgi:beta-glucosidase